ncbi:P-loop containing nucleoside triphosphate hydrolase protein [Auricularia subglabra TFB-10046 SS5]|nr:P-loop containing nucleoside triphosphate hydrolase protein [Auricularia subglabra TFB-10046 SS5]
MAPDSEILAVHNLTCERDGIRIIDDLSFALANGDILVLRGRSGTGKTTLLKCVAHLTSYKGAITLGGKSPQDYGIPQYRTRVLYLPQRVSLLPGTPRSFLDSVCKFKSRRGSGAPLDTTAGPLNAENVAETWGIESELWDRPWNTLSGGEAQRIALAVAVAFQECEVLLLDEPTSALDQESSIALEEYLVQVVRSPQSRVKAIVWITHSDDQAHRVGTRFLYFKGHGIVSEDEVHGEP